MSAVYTHAKEAPLEYIKYVVSNRIHRVCLSVSGDNVLPTTEKHVPVIFYTFLSSFYVFLQ